MADHGSKGDEDQVEEENDVRASEMKMKMKIDSLKAEAQHMTGQVQRLLAELSASQGRERSLERAIAAHAASSHSHRSQGTHRGPSGSTGPNRMAARSQEQEAEVDALAGSLAQSRAEL